MGFRSVHQLLCLLLHIVAYLRTLDADKVFPPENKFCLFTTGDLIFDERMKKIAPSATLAGVGSFTATSAQYPSGYTDDTISLQRLFGVVYYISNDDKTKVEEAAYNRMILADYEIYLEYEKKSSDSIECLCMDEGLLPHAFPLPIYSEFPRELTAQNYVDRLKKIQVNMEYRFWLERELTSKANDPNAPKNSFTRPSCFVPPPIPHASTPPTIVSGPGPEIQEYDVPKDKFCVFVANDLVFPEVMNRIALSAVTLGAGMLRDRYIALGGQTVPGKYQQYRGFDKIWGVVYLIDGEDFERFLRYGVTYSFFLANVRTIFNVLQQATCMTYDIGLVPSGFPYQVFQPKRFTLQHYLKRLTDVGVPPGYVKAIENLAKLLKIETNEAQIAAPGAQTPSPSVSAEPKPQNAGAEEEK